MNASFFRHRDSRRQRINIFHEIGKSETANLFYFCISENKKLQMHSISSFLKIRGWKFNPFIFSENRETQIQSVFIPSENPM